MGFTPNFEQPEIDPHARLQLQIAHLRELIESQETEIRRFTDNPEIKKKFEASKALYQSELADAEALLQKMN